jgi:flavin reductase (DIM6/NTAB) family NADH-FMN oxidoreductase RutF
VQLDPASLDKASAYHLFISLLLPRPIAWVGSISAAGVDNLAPFSYFMGVGSAPPLLAFSVARGRGGVLKDTARNLLETKECTITMVERANLDVMHATSAPWTESEFDAVGVARAPSVRVRPPRVGNGRIAMECVLSQALDLHQTHLFVVQVVHLHIADELYRDGVITLDGYEPMARLGGDAYAGLGEILHRGR